MSHVHDFDSAMDIRFGDSPELDAMLLHFMTENGLEYTIDPLKNASPEQVRFMVARRGETFYAPCSDWMFLLLLKPGPNSELMKNYREIWKNLVLLVYEFVPQRSLRRKILNLCRYKFRMAINASILIPSRLMKRLLTIFMTQSGIDDPYMERKRKRNAMAQKVLDSEDWDRAVYASPDSLASNGRIDDLRYELDFLELKRIIAMASVTQYDDVASYFTALGRVDQQVENCRKGFEPLRGLLDPRNSGPLKILMLPSGTGSILFDLELVRALVNQGHRVVLALKEGFYFDYACFWDADNDPVLTESLQNAHLLTDLDISKNDLLREIREHPFVVISDGTRERLNPYRMSVAIARAWKECDLIMIEGYGQYRRIFETGNEFTRDVFSYYRDEQGKLRLGFRPKAAWVRKFSERYISAKADEIIMEMRQAREQGQTIIFYSGVIGSIPGQVTIAIKVINTFVADLRKRLDSIYVINPGEHFEKGMDADDLMFMWEQVQRSGLLNVWRFQSVQDIEHSFALMGEKVPPVWAGKDSTYSTGCTKEMQIALNVQKEHRELQIIGPSPERFFRRREYRVGKFCDIAIDESRV